MDANEMLEPGPSCSGRSMRTRRNLSKTCDPENILNIIETSDLSDIDLDSDGDEDYCPTPSSTSQHFVNPRPRNRVGMDKQTEADDCASLPGEGNDDENDEEIEDVSTPINDSQYINKITPKAEIKWRRRPFLTKSLAWQSSDQECLPEVQSPLFYFSRYIKDEHFDNMATFTNMYALQQGSLGFNATDASELQVLFGLHIITGCLRFPRVRLYWDTLLGINIFSNSMTRDRFFQLRNNLHAVNNLEIPEGNKDRLFKVRPLLNAVRSRCLELTLERDLCIDEQIIPFRGQLSIKQYIKGKPQPWGIKMFILCGKSGIAYDFIPYQGSNTGLDPNHLKAFGLAASVVLQLSTRISNPGHKLYYDNYFSSYHLLQILKSKDILAAGTARVNRFANTSLIPDKEAKKKERGFSDQVISTDGDVVMVKWLDNRTVALASNFVGIGEEDEVDRWDKGSKSYVKVKRPEVVKLYNHGMGGVDLLDQLIALYRIYIRSKKWTLRVIMHCVDLALVNSWQEYRQDCTRNNVSKRQVLDLLHFKMRCAEGLILVGKTKKKKRGRPSLEMPSRKQGRGERRPCMELQYDNTDHMPQNDQQKSASRCKNIPCKGKSYIFCDKCNVHLCLSRERNCFQAFHRKN